MLVEITSGQNGNAPGPEIIRRNIVAGRRGALVDRQNLAIGPRIECIAACAGQERNVRADGSAFEPGNGAQCSQRLLREMLPRVEIGILRLRQGDKTDPDVFAVVADVLPVQPHKTGDEQRGAGEQRYGKGHLRPDQNLAEAQLMRTTARPAPAFFQTFN